MLAGTAVAVVAALAACSSSSGSAGGASGPLEKKNIVVDAFPAIDGQLAGTYDITSADYVTYFDNVLLKKTPLRIVAESSFLQPNVLALLAKPQSDITSVRQLKNQVVSVNAPNDIGTLLVDSLLSDNGVPLKSVTINSTVKFPSVGQELGQGKIAAGFAAQPYVSLDAMLTGTQELADLDQGGTTDFPIQGIAVTASWAKQNPNTLAAFERAYSQGQRLVDAMVRFGCSASSFPPSRSAASPAPAEPAADPAPARCPPGRAAGILSHCDD